MLNPSPKSCMQALGDMEPIYAKKVFNYCESCHGELYCKTGLLETWLPMDFEMPRFHANPRECGGESTIWLIPTTVTLWETPLKWNITTEPAPSMSLSCSSESSQPQQPHHSAFSIHCYTIVVIIITISPIIMTIMITIIMIIIIIIILIIINLIVLILITHHHSSLIITHPDHKPVSL